MADESSSITRPHAADEPPPFLGSWQRVYAAILAYLVAIISLLHLFTRTFQR